MLTPADHNLLLPLALFLLLLLPHPTDAQQTSTPSPTYGFSSKFNPTVAVVVVLLISAFFFAGFLFVYCRQRATQRRDGSIRRAWIATARSRRHAAVEAARGLDPETVAAFPTVVYADVKGHRLGDHAEAPLECAVCLCEFGEEEELALLPKCSHAFHPVCVAEWLRSHTTCPVCRANLAAEEGEGGSCEPAGADSTSGSGSVADESRPARTDDHHVPVVAIQVDDDDEEAELTRMGSTRKDPLPPAKKSLRTWRSRSARPAIGDRVGQFWGEEERERFTLRLPEEVRREVIAGKLPRSGSVSGAFSAGTGLRSTRRGYIGGGGGAEGSSRSGRKSYKTGLGRWDRKAKSDRGWAALGRAVAGMGSRHGAGGSRRGGVEGERAAAAQAPVPGPSPVAADGTGVNDVVIKAAGGEADGEGSVTNRGANVLDAVRDQFNCLIRGGSKQEQGSSSGKDDDEASTAARNKV